MAGSKMVQVKEVRVGNVVYIYGDERDAIVERVETNEDGYIRFKWVPGGITHRVRVSHTVYMDPDSSMFIHDFTPAHLMMEEV